MDSKSLSLYLGHPFHHLSITGYWSEGTVLHAPLLGGSKAHKQKRTEAQSQYVARSEVAVEVVAPHVRAWGKFQDCVTRQWDIDDGILVDRRLRGWDRSVALLHSGAVGANIVLEWNISVDQWVWH